MLQITSKLDGKKIKFTDHEMKFLSIFLKEMLTVNLRYADNILERLCVLEFYKKRVNQMTFPSKCTLKVLPHYAKAIYTLLRDTAIEEGIGDAIRNEIMDKLYKTYNEIL